METFNIITKEIEKEIDIEFSKAFLSELHKIIGFNISSICDDDLLNYAGTSAWEVAFLNACRKQDKQELCKFYVNLNWASTDDFDEELSRVLINQHLIIPSVQLIQEDIKEIVAKEHNLEKNEIFFCDICYRPYHIKYQHKKKKYHHSETLIMCEGCKDDDAFLNNEMDDKEEQAYSKRLDTSYYETSLSFSPIPLIEKYTIFKESDLFTCPHCHKIYTKLNLNKETNFCEYCTILESNIDEQKNYYKNSIKQNKEYVESINNS